MWSASVFIGGIICGFINRDLKKSIFVIQLVAASLIFVFLEELHIKPRDFEVAITVVICGIFYGGPYNLISTAVPIMLGSKP
jgi:hypothetical protein